MLELFARFWYRHFRYNVCFPPKLESILETMKCTFSETREGYSIDLLTAGIKSKFSADEQKMLLMGLIVYSRQKNGTNVYC